MLKYANPLLVMAEEDAELIPVDDFDDGVVGRPCRNPVFFLSYLLFGQNWMSLIICSLLRVSPTKRTAAS